MIDNIELSQVAKIIDCEHKTAPLEFDGIPSIRTPNIGKGRLLLENVNRVSQRTYQLWTKRAIPEANDIILAREAPVGNAAIIPSGLKVCLGQRTVLIKIKKDKISPRYLTYLINSPAVNTHLINISNGATVGHLNVTDIRRLKLPNLPKLQIQKKIAAILSAYDDLVENNNRRITILEKMAEELYREWFVRYRFPGHGRIEIIKGAPAVWRVVEARSLIKTVIKGKSYSSVEINELGEGKPFVNLKSFNRGGGYRSDGLKYYTGRYNQDQVALEGDVVMAVTDMTQDRAVVGRVARLPKGEHSDYVISLDTVKLMPVDGIDTATLYSFMKYSSIGNSLKEFANGANVLHLKPELIQKQKIILPDISLLQRYGKLVEPIHDQLDLLSSINANMRESRDRLLSRLMNGKIDVENLDIQLPPSMKEEKEFVCA